MEISRRLLRSRPAGRVAAAAVAVAAAVLVPTPHPIAQPRPPTMPAIHVTSVFSIVPSRMIVPKIHVSAPIVPVGTDSTGAMETPSSARDVAWWSGTQPGAGNALFAGHRDWKGAEGSFYRLKELGPGDRITIVGERATLTFHVTWVRQFHGDTAATSLLHDTHTPSLTLITCGGAFDRSIRHYKDRIVARAILDA